MSWIAWVLIGLHALSAISTVAMVGKRREPVTSVAAILSVGANALLIWAVVTLATGVDR